MGSITCQPDRLFAKRVDDDGNGTFDRAQRFVYDGFDIVLVYDDAGSLENRYLYGPATDQFFADEDALGEVLWGLTDHQRTVRDLVEYDAATDTTSVVNHIKYDSFGNITNQSNSANQPLFAFTGRFLDEDTGLQWHNARWYEPLTALWLSPDPIGFAGGDTNLYRYVGNNPVNATDPTGTTTETQEQILADFRANLAGMWESGRIGGEHNNRMRALYGQGAPPSDGPSLLDDLWIMANNPLATMAGFGRGYADGSAMVVNAFTFGQIDWLDYEVEQMIQRERGLYAAANVSAKVGALAAYTAVALGAIEAAAAAQASLAAAAQAQWAALGQMTFFEGSFVVASGNGTVAVAAVAVTGQEVAVAVAGLATVYMGAMRPPEDLYEEFWRLRGQRQDEQAMWERGREIADEALAEGNNRRWLEMSRMNSEQAARLKAIKDAINELIDRMLAQMGL